MYPCRLPITPSVPIILSSGWGLLPASLCLWKAQARCGQVGSPFPLTGWTFTSIRNSVIQQALLWFPSVASLDPTHTPLVSKGS